MKSYDFDRYDDCYYVGIAGDEVWHDGCYRQEIKVKYRVWNGEKRESDLPDVILPPANGVPRAIGGFCNGIRKIEG